MTNKTVVSYSSNFTMFPQDSAFYVAGGGNCWIATVTHNGLTTDICCDGEMRIPDWKDPAFVGDNYYDLWRYTEDLIYAGIDTDDKLLALNESGRVEWVNNSWFDLYDTESGEHLDCITHTLDDAVHACMTRDEWTSL